MLALFRFFSKFIDFTISIQTKGSKFLFISAAEIKNKTMFSIHVIICYYPYIEISNHSLSLGKISLVNIYHGNLMNYMTATLSFLSATY